MVFSFFDLVLIADVAGDPDGAIRADGFIDLGRRCVELILLARGNHDLGAVVG
jgi:hypothetical protein